MKGICSIILITLLLSSCSTVERRNYYSPNVTSNNIEGPEKPTCGFSNFGGLPDTYSGDSPIGIIKVTTDQNWHPYLWGPWFLTIVPVFPITWVTEAFVNDDLQLTIYIENEKTTPEESLLFSISTSSNGDKLKPSESSVYNGDGYTYHHLTFPIDYDEIDEFTLSITGNSDELTVPFKEASRWSWSQWTPNC